MPVFTSAGSDWDTSHLSGHLHGHQPLVLKFSILIGAATAVIAVSFLLQHVALTWLSGQYPRHNTSGRSRTVTSASGPPPDLKSLTDSSRTPPGRGPSRIEKQASWAISRGEAGGTAPLGLDGSVEGSSLDSMDEEKGTTPTRDWSRGVSTHLSSEAAQDPDGLPYSCQIIPAADEEEGDDVRIQQFTSYTSPLGPTGGASVGSTWKERDRMDDDLFGRQSGPGTVMAASSSTTPMSGQPENIAGGAPVAALAIGGVPTWRRRFEISFSRSSSPSHSPLIPPTLASNTVYLAHRTSFEVRRPQSTYAQSVPASTDIVRGGSTRLAGGESPDPDHTNSGTSPCLGTSGPTPKDPASTGIPRRRSYTKDPPIPPTTALDVRDPQDSSGHVIDESRATHLKPGRTFTPASYPSTSPFLPPSPSTMDHQFDLGQIMFPGAGATDGGVRVIHAFNDHGHDESGSTGVQVDFNNGLDDSGTGWKRHTRVYGGGVCLACAAAGGGGFYGARVRPEDKRCNET